MYSMVTKKPLYINLSQTTIHQNFPLKSEYYCKKYSNGERQPVKMFTI